MELAAGKCGTNKRRWLSTPRGAELWSSLPQAVQEGRSLHRLAKCRGTHLHGYTQMHGDKKGYWELFHPTAAGWEALQKGSSCAYPVLVLSSGLPLGVVLRGVV